MAWVKPWPIQKPSAESRAITPAALQRKIRMPWPARTGWVSAWMIQPARAIAAKAARKMTMNMVRSYRLCAGGDGQAHKPRALSLACSAAASKVRLMA